MNWILLWSYDFFLFIRNPSSFNSFFAHCAFEDFTHGHVPLVRIVLKEGEYRHSNVFLNTFSARSEVRNEYDSKSSSSDSKMRKSRKRTDEDWFSQEASSWPSSNLGSRNNLDYPIHNPGPTSKRVTRLACLWSASRLVKRSVYCRKKISWLILYSQWTPGLRSLGTRTHQVSFGSSRNTSGSLSP